MVMATSLLFGACSGDGKTCDRATQQKGNTENVIGRSDIKVKDGRMTPEVLWALGRSSAGPWPPQWRCSGWSTAGSWNASPTSRSSPTTAAASSPILPGAWSGTTTSTRCAWGTRTSSSPTSRSNTSAACTTTPPTTAIPPGSAAAWISRASASSSSPQISPSATRKACASSATPSPPWTPSIWLRGIAARFSRATPWISSGCR